MDGTRFVLAGSLVDGRGAGVLRNVFIEVKEGIIISIGPAADLSCDNKTAIDDFSHCTIVPVLVDCSVSLTQSPSMDTRVHVSAEESDHAIRLAMLEQHIHYCHIHGVLGVADSDAITDLVDCYKKKNKKNIITIRSPRVFYKERQKYSGDDSPDSDFLKINYSGNIENAESFTSQLNYKDLLRILQLRGEKKVVVVANGQQQVGEALEAGCDAIEQGYGMGEDNLKRMAEKNVLWIPSVLRAKNGLDGSSGGGDVCCRFSLQYVAPGKPVPGAEAFWKKVLAEQLGQLRFARKIGVKTAIGTGAGSVGLLHGESMVEEIKLFIKAGYSLEEAIRCASENGARFFDMDNLGTLTVGRKATFLITRGTAKQLPRKLSYLEGIYVEGKPSVKYRKNPFKTVS